MLRVPRRAISLSRNSFRQSAARAAAIVALAIVLAASASAHSVPSWSYASSDHFEAYAAGDERHAREAIADFERFQAFFEQLFNVPPSSAPRTRLVIFSTAKDFAPYKPNDNANAFWLNTPDGDFIVMHSLNTAGLPVAVHEFAHLMLSRTGADYPLWLNEGLAQFYSTMKVEGAKVRLGVELPHAIETLAKAGKLIPLDRLFAIGERSPEDNDPRVAPVLYAECWALTHMLLTHEQYRDRTPALFAAIAHGAPAMQAVLDAYGKSLDMIHADLRKYIGRFKLDSRLVDAPGAARDMHVTSKAADEDDVSVTLASVLGWQPGRDDESRAGMAALEARGPIQLRLAEARGLLENYTAHCDAARAYLAKAVALGSVNTAVLRAYANLIAGSDPEQEKTLLKKADAIAPQSGDALVRLAIIPCGGGGAITATRGRRFPHIPE